MRTLLLLCLLSGCLDADSTKCAGDLTCPSDAMCRAVDGNDECVTQNDVDACVGKSEGDGCDDLDPGRVCRDGACIDLCGNGRVNTGETCDEGDQLAGDGCSSSCLKEICGNGAIDTVNFEVCDSGRQGVSGVGCSSTCEFEQSQWTKLEPGLSPRAMFAMAFDEERQQVVGFGGLGPTGYLADTYLFDVVTRQWRGTALGVSPPARGYHSMAYDYDRKRVVLFGGFGETGMLGDTWEWDGVAWEDRTPVVSPPARRSAQLAYDRKRHRTVVVGGSDVHALSTQALDGLIDMWEWDGTTWMNMTTPLIPPPAATGYEQVLLGYDHTRDLLVACGIGGLTHVWSAMGWTSKGSCTPFFADAQMTFQKGPNVMIARSGNGLFYTFTANGTNWTLLENPGPTPLRGATLVNFEPTVMMFGGHDDPLYSPFGKFNSETHFRDPSGPPFQPPSSEAQALLRWPRIEDANPIPPGEEQQAFAWDREHGRGMMYGGETDGARTAWFWSLSGWQGITDPDGTFYSTPAPTFGQSMAYDLVRDRFVLVGGEVLEDDTGDLVPPRTYEHDGVEWIDVTGGTQPPGRRNAAMAFDEPRGVTMLFGGVDLETGATRDDQWTWDGTTWLDETPSIRPQARSDAAMGYDPIRKRVVLFGGERAPLAHFGDTWEWDGTAWTEIATTNGPTARSSARFVYDPNREVMLLFGGVSFSTQRYSGEIWAWDGATWELLADDPTMARFGHVAFYDTVRNGLLTFGGRRSNDFGSILSETWLHRFTAASSREQCADPAIDADGDMLAGCDDPDCFGRCWPMCRRAVDPETTCSDTPHCGDGTCAGPLEDRVLCPQDC